MLRVQSHFHRLCARLPTRLRARCVSDAAAPPRATASLDGVTIVDSVESATRVAAHMRSLGDKRIHAWDTEVADIDAASQSPVGNGRIICASVYSGPDVDYGSGPRVWIDSMATPGVLEQFTDVLHDTAIRKAWHNYGFDRHVFYNHGIDVRGFAGDTMHMARLWDTARLKKGGYALDALAADLCPTLPRKVSMKELFGKPKLKKDGSPGKERILAPLQEVQAGSDTRSDWIHYSTLDAELTWFLRSELEGRLRDTYWIAGQSMWDFYKLYFVPFGECLTDMERAGIYVDVKEHLPRAERTAIAERMAAQTRFIDWATKFCPDAARFNVGSDVQKAHFLFAPCKRVRPGSKASSSASAAAVKAKRRAAASKAAASSVAAPASAATAEGTKKPRAKRAPAVVDVQDEDEHVGATAAAAATDAHPLLQRVIMSKAVPSSSFSSTSQLPPALTPIGGGMPSPKRKMSSAAGTADAPAPAPPPAWRRPGYGSSDSDTDGVVTVSLLTDDIDANSDLDEVDERIYFGLDSDDESMVDADGRRRTITPHRVAAMAKREMTAAAAASASGDVAAPGMLTRESDAWPATRVFKVENTEQYIEPGKKIAKKQRDVVLYGLGIPPVARTESGWPAASAKVLQTLAGKVSGSQPAYGRAFEYFGGGQEGKEACEALHSLYTISTIDTMLSNFIIPLQSMADASSRVHCSLNLNTETGRLSARRPNLQNQPALEKDVYGIRKAFRASPGNKLIVADYGQLELRLLAHMARCTSMLDAFAAGGDFHSRTAMGMYSYIADALKSRNVLLEWDEKQGKAPAPLLKDMFANERRKAKILNFSIAYGKTAMGLSRDWNVSLTEAKETVDKWYSDRPEVRDWQKRVLEAARRDGATRTLLGRYRHLRDINARDFRARGHAERAAINTPIQGGAADVAMAAMLKLWRNPKIAQAGWRMLLQIHDEVILEGPAESANEVLALTKEDMGLPFDQPLLVQLVVDAKIVDTWYEAK